MKKLTILLCCILLLQLLCACNGNTEEFTTPVNYYYTNETVHYNSVSGVLRAEVREGASLQGNITAYLHSYLRGPTSDDLKSAIPPEVYLVSCSVDGNVATIVLSSNFSKLTGVDLSTSCSALLLSVHDFAEIDTVHFSAKDAKLDDKDVYTITIDDIILLDTVSMED